MKDQPQLVLYSLVGNDVCDPNRMTKPTDFYNYIVTALNFLDTKLPSGSHVVMTGLANGSVLYDSLSEAIHPLGKTRMDVKYKTFYTWLSCIEVKKAF